MAGFNINHILSSKSKSETSSRRNNFMIESIELRKIYPSKKNGYNTDDIKDLKASIELIGLQQNLVVKEIDYNTYELISGHRRFKALCELSKENKNEYLKAPCVVRRTVICGDEETQNIENKTDEVLSELELIFANSTTRILGDYEKVYQVKRLNELLTNLKNSGYKFTGRTREIVADFLNVSPAQVGKMESINNNLSNELKEEFKQGNINITTAYEVSRLEEIKQTKVLDQFKQGKNITPTEVKKIRDTEQWTFENQISLNGVDELETIEAIEAEQKGYAKIELTENERILKDKIFDVLNENLAPTLAKELIEKIKYELKI